MFTIKKLSSIKKELYNSLQAEVKETIKTLPKSIAKDASKTASHYAQSKSIAGLELWINSASEYRYFEDIKKDLKEYSRSDSKEIKLFQEEITDLMKEDFGAEDFRFIKWEREKSLYKNLENKLTGFMDDSLQNLIAVRPELDLGEERNIGYYKKSSGDPSKKGLDVKLLVKKTPLDKQMQVLDAENSLSVLWPEGFDLYRLLTDKLHIVSSPGLVSYSHFHEQGISYINFIDRELLDSIDDLIHENAHHHLNLIIKKHKVFKKDFKDDIFYSPWRRSLRSMYGIIHASFTFSYAALLFYNILLSQDFDKTPLTHADLDRARMRFLEETLMVNYSLDDLKWGTEKGLFTKKGIEIIKALDLFNAECMKYVNTIYSTIESKGHRKEIETLLNTLNEAKNSYPLP